MHRLVLMVLFASIVVACGQEPPKKDDTVVINNGSSNNDVSNNGASNNGTSNNGASNNGASNNATSNNGNTNNGNTNNGNTNNGNTNNGNTNNTTGGWNDEYETIVTELTFVDDATSPLNPIIDQTLDPSAEYPLILLMEFGDLTPLDRDFRFRSDNGRASTTSGTYRWGVGAAPPQTTGTFDSVTGAFDATLQLWFIDVVIETDGILNEVEIGLYDAQFTGELNAGPPAIAEGTVVGYVERAEADTVRIQLTADTTVTLTELLGEDNLNYDASTGQTVTPGSPSADAWLVEADFTAEATRIDD